MTNPECLTVSTHFAEPIPVEQKKKPKETNTNLLKNLVVTLRAWVKFDHFPP